MSRLSFDESLLPKLEALYRTRDVLRRRQLVRDALAVEVGDRVLDVGCGPGFYVAELAEQVGPTGSVVGVDGSAEMLAAATRRCQEFEHASFLTADVTSLPVPDSSFDAALCVQVLEYVPDASTALAEMYRALRPGGRAVVWDIDWGTVSIHSSDQTRTERVLRAWDGHLAHPSLPRTLATRLRSVGFSEVRVDGHVFATPDFTPDAYGVSVLPVIEQYVAGHEAIGEVEAKAWGDELRELGTRDEFFFACVQFCFTGMRPE